MPAKPVEVVDTVGAGDAFMTGTASMRCGRWICLAPQRRGDLAGIGLAGLEDVVDKAAHSAALTVAREGA